MKMLLATSAGLAYLAGCAQQTFTVQNKPAAGEHQRNHHPSFLRFWNWAEENCRCSQNLWRAQKMLLKQKPSKHSVNGLLGFITLYLYCWKRVCIAHNNCNSLPIDMGNSICKCSLIYFWVPSSCFCIVISLSEGEIIPFSGVCQSGRLWYPRRRRWWLHALIDRLLWCATDDDQRQHHHAEHHFQL